MDIPQSLNYTKSHEWVRIEGSVAVIGITDHAQSELGDIVFVELPEVGQQVVLDESFGVVEAVKTVSDLYSPLSGTVVEINEALADEAEIINSDPYDKGWMIKVEFTDDNESVTHFLDASAYQEFIAQSS